MAAGLPPLFFVLGEPKSGTTWLQLALNSHPEVICKGEGKFHYFRDRLAEAGVAYNRFIKERNTKVFGSETFPPIKIGDVDYLFGQFVERRLREGEMKPGLRQLGSKDPDFGLYIMEYAALFPRAAYLHVIRDPRDACVSMAHHMRRVHPEVNHGSFDSVLIDTARGWRNYIATVRAEAASRNLKYLEFTYEEMAADAGATLTRIFDFLDVDVQAETVARCIDASSFRLLSNGRDPGQEDRSSFFRKGIAGGWVKDLTPAQADAVMSATGDIARGLGYA